MVYRILLCSLLIGAVTSAVIEPEVKAEFSSGRIVNGHEAEVGEAPYIVSLSHWGEQYCAGVIIDKHWVLTAAHCLMYDYINIYAGLHSRVATSEGQYRFVAGKKFQISHEKYIGGVAPYDIGLIYINIPFEFNTDDPTSKNLVGPIELSSGKYSPVGRGKIYGWGMDKYWTKPVNLHTLDVDVIDYEPCKAALPVNSKIHETNICTYTPGLFDGSCNGDSGGPLINGHNELIGLVSWGYSPCDATRYPSVYTWIDPHREWIKEQIQAYTP